MEFDHVIVGGGSAGCAVAGRLAEDPALRVCLVEAGPPDGSALVTTPVGAAALLPWRNARNWAFQTVPQPGLNGRRGYQPRGRGLGGSSSLNAMIYLRGHPEDYEDWARAGCTGWGWAEVLPVFRRAEDNARGADAFHGSGGPMHVCDGRSANPFAALFIEAARQAGLPFNPDFNGASQDGAGWFQLTQHGGERWNAARAYLHARPRPNLHVVTGAQVEQLLLDARDGGLRARGVQLRRGGAAETIAARGEVVLAAGAFGSPQLLMLSGIGPGEHLQSLGLPVRLDRPAVGANLQDHLDIVAHHRFRADPGSPRRATELFGLSAAGAARLLARELPRYLRERRGLLTSNFAEAGAFLRTGPGLSRPDVQLYFVVAMVDDHARRVHLGHGYSCHASVLRPKSRGSVRLASPHAHDTPLIDPAFLSHPEDLAATMRAERAMRHVLAQPALARHAGPALHALPQDDAALAADIRARADSMYHPAGTCRMGGDVDAVVDPFLRVRGVAGLRVADASVMPTLVGGSLHAAAVMIGERAAGFIRGDA
ncbi:GMC family oxidoreductase [Caldimonas tepidiphila]|uniref:GMC family oxidoreductase n=1 Tax=Caldimonas tepidiphila TaxID=2315841 RepID=UPI000E5BC15F|nr:GMC family oxidoreductase N-terminal domain-containing protein [Caldimonas tepidiphila]